MNRSKNDHIIEMAKKFIDNCNSFEIKDLDADKHLYFTGAAALRLCLL